METCLVSGVCLLLCFVVVVFWGIQIEWSIPFHPLTFLRVKCVQIYVQNWFVIAKIPSIFFPSNIAWLYLPYSTYLTDCYFRCSCLPPTLRVYIFALPHICCNMLTHNIWLERIFDCHTQFPSLSFFKFTFFCHACVHVSTLHFLWHSLSLPKGGFSRTRCESWCSQ